MAVVMVDLLNIDFIYCKYIEIRCLQVSNQMSEVYHRGHWMTSHFLLSFAAILLFLIFLYSSGSHSNTQIKCDTDGLLIRDTRSLASKAVLRRDNINALLSPHIYNALVRQEHQVTEVTEPLVLGGAAGGESCLEQATQFCSGGDQLRLARISFKDSTMKWTLCHCVPTTPWQATRNPEPWSYLLSHLSRLPVPLRRQIGTIMLAPLPHSPLVTSTHQDTTPPHGMFTASPPLVIFFGYPSIGTWIHEFAHSVDFQYSTAMFSGSKQWARALEGDSCVTDEYAGTSREEALAQAAIVKLYLAERPPVSSGYSSRNVEGVFTEVSYVPGPSWRYTDALLGDYSCMKHQLMALGCLDAWYTSAQQSDGCAELGDTVHDMLKEQKITSPSGTWWELWLVTDLLLILFMLAQL
jgi:hypothetical protein